MDPLVSSSLDGATVYDPDPNPLSKKAPSKSVIADTAGDPVVLRMSTFGTLRTAGGPIALPYVTTPVIVGNDPLSIATLPFVVEAAGSPSLNANPGWKLLLGSV
jgi:hypothetical protein